MSRRILSTPHKASFAASFHSGREALERPVDLASFTTAATGCRRVSFLIPSRDGMTRTRDPSLKAADLASLPLLKKLIDAFNEFPVKAIHGFLKDSNALKVFGSVSRFSKI